MLYRCSPSNNVIEFNLAHRYGKFVAAYTVQTATNKKLLYSILDNGNCLNTTVQDEAIVLENTALNFFNDTHIAISWFKSTTGTIYKEINLNTGYSTNYTLLNKACYPKLTSNEFGTIIAWSESTATCNPLRIKQNYGQHYQYTVPNACSGSLDVLAIKDKTILAWAQFTDNTNPGDIKLQIFNASLQPTTTAKQITQEPGTEASPSLTELDDSSFGLAWNALPTGPLTDYDVFMQTLTLNGNTITGKTQLNKYTLRDQMRPILAENQGIVAAVWESIGQDNGDSQYEIGIYGKIFFLNGTLIKDEFRINQITAGDQTKARVVAKDNSFVFGYVSQDTINLETFDITPYIPKKEDVTKTKILRNLPKTHTDTASNTNTHTQTQTHSSSVTASISESETLEKPSVSSTIFQQTNTTEINTYTHTHSQTRTITPTPKPILQQQLTQAPKIADAIPSTQKAIAANTAAGASVASVLTLSTTNVAMGSRINTAEKLSSCESVDFQNITFPKPSWSHHPLQFAIGDSPLKYEIGALVGNLALYVGSVAILTGISWAVGAISSGSLITAYALGAPAIFFPGSHALLAAYFFPEIASSSATLIKYGSTGVKIAAALSLAMMGAHSIYYGNFLLTLEATFSTKKLKWRAPQNKPGYMKQYGTYFDDYSKSKLEAFPVDNLFNIATGFLSGFNPNELSECNNMLYSGTGLYSGYFLYLLVRRPYISTFNNVFYISMAALQATPLILNTIQVNSPGLKNSTSMNMAIEIMPVIANYALTAKSVFDIGKMIKESSCYKSSMPDSSSSDSSSSDSDNDNSQQLLRVLAPSSNTAAPSQTHQLKAPIAPPQSSSSNGMTQAQHNPLNSATTNTGTFAPSGHKHTTHSKAPGVTKSLFYHKAGTEDFSIDMQDIVGHHINDDPAL